MKTESENKLGQSQELSTTPDESPRPAQSRLLFRFVSFGDWVGHATQRFQRAGVRGKDVVCLDTKGRVCKIGKDFMLADAEGAFPVMVYGRETERDAETTTVE